MSPLESSINCIPLTRTLGTTIENFYVDSGDKLTEVRIGSTTVKSFSYDTAGRTTWIAYSGSTTTLAYDYESRLTSITRSGVTTNSNSYNGLDTRYSAVDSVGTKTFKRAGAGVLAPVLGDGSAVYTPGISERRSSTTTYSHPGIKSGEAQSSASQVIGATRQYDAFGNLDSSTGTWKGPFGYGGAFGYQETGDHGLRLLGHRYYDSNTGRFLTRDPIKDGRNWYGYCDGNPTSNSDADGNKVRSLNERERAWLLKNIGRIHDEGYQGEARYLVHLVRAGKVTIQSGKDEYRQDVFGNTYGSPVTAFTFADNIRLSASFLNDPLCNNVTLQGTLLHELVHVGQNEWPGWVSWLTGGFSLEKPAYHVELAFYESLLNDPNLRNRKRRDAIEMAIMWVREAAGWD